MKIAFSTILISLLFFGAHAQKNKIEFEEYDLDNGMHVILHKDHSTPIAAVSILYHVGSKNENPERTGFAHFFEHLMFEGSKNIERGEYSNYVEKNGGTLNAFTTQDQTFYFELLPSNNLELGLWLESERLLHAKVDNVGIETQREVVKEERRQRVENVPYGTLGQYAFEGQFKEHPYKWQPIGSMEHLNAAEEKDYVEFYQTFYVPANATLVIAGDIDIKKTKQLVNKYFASIPKGQAINLYRDFLDLSDADFKEKYGKDKSIFNQDDFFKTTSKEGKAMIAEYENKETIIPRPNVVEPPLTEEVRKTYRENVPLKAAIITYRTPKQNDKDTYALEMLNIILSQGSSSRIRKSIVEEKELALEAQSFIWPLEDPGLMLFFGIANKDAELDDIVNEIDAQIEKVQTELVSEREFQKVKNQLENQFVSSASSISGISTSLASYHVFYGDANLINNQLSLYESITREDLKRVANKYLKKDARSILYYLPQED